MKLPGNAKFWASVLIVLLLIIASCVIYIANKSEEPQSPTNETLNRHLEDLQLRATKEADREIDLLIAQ